MSTRLLLVVVLIVPTASAQHYGASGGGIGRAAGPATMPARPVNPAGFRAVRARNRGLLRGGFGYGAGYGWPYFPIGDYDLLSPLDYGDDFAGGYPQYISPGNIAFVPVAPVAATPPKPASSVIHEYNFREEPVTRSGERPTFTIVLKDGSTRSAAASWVAGSELHYLDLQSRQQTLSPELIDRDATERINEAKNLSMELPPG